jgi:hypothetical protein
MDRFDVVASTDREELGETPNEPNASSHPEGALWLSAIADNVLLFGVDLEGLDDAAGTAAHELAHVFRLLHSSREERTTTSPYRRDVAGEGRVVESADSWLEEARVAAIEVALGFGVLAMNHSLVAERPAPVINSRFLEAPILMRPRPRHLPPEATAFLLAYQLVARGASRKEGKRLAEQMHPDQRDIFLEVLDSVDEDRAKAGLSEIE